MYVVEGKVGYRELIRRSASWTVGVFSGLIGGMLFAGMVMTLGGSAYDRVGESFGVMAAVAFAITAIALLVARRHLLDARALRIDAHGVRGRAGGREVNLVWAEVSLEVDLEKGRPALVLRSAEHRLPVWLAAYANRDAVLGGLRRWCPGYALAAVDEELLVVEPHVRRGVVRARERQGAGPPSPSAPAEPAGYRVGPGATRSELPDTPTVLRRLASSRLGLCTLALSAITIAGGVVIGVIGIPAARRFAIAVTFLAGSLAFLGLFMLAALAREIRRHRAFLGENLREIVPGVWEGEDGSRSRLAGSDLGDRWRGPHWHLERVAPDGTTVVTHVLPTPPSQGPEARACEAWHAPVAPTAYRPVCLRSAPWARRAEPYGEPKHLLLERHENGFVLTRFDAHLAYAGDTWHPTHAHAEQQLMFELGVDVGWRRLPEPPTDYAFLTPAHAPAPEPAPGARK